MGRALLEAAGATEGVRVGAALEAAGSPWVGRDAVLIVEDPVGEEFTRRFAASEQLATLQAPLPGGAARTMNVYLLHDFKGY